MSILDMQNEDGYDEIQDELADDIMLYIAKMYEMIEDMDDKGMLDLWDRGDFDDMVQELEGEWYEPEDGEDVDVMVFYDKVMRVWKEDFLPEYRKKIAEWIVMCRDADWTGEEIVNELDLFFKVK